MEPRIYPPWEPRPLQELGPGLRHAVEAVRGEDSPRPALQRALERAGEIPETTRVSRPWFRRRVVLAAVTLAASLLIALGIWAVLTAPGSTTIFSPTFARIRPAGPCELSTNNFAPSNPPEEPPNNN